VSRPADRTDRGRRDPAVPDRGASVAVALTGVYLGAFGLAHPLARKVGSWPAVLGVTAATAAVAAASGDRDRD
jgi:hypothetical protein